MIVKYGEDYDAIHVEGVAQDFIPGSLRYQMDGERIEIWSSEDEARVAKVDWRDLRDADGLTFQTEIAATAYLAVVFSRAPYGQKNIADLPALP